MVKRLGCVWLPPAPPVVIALVIALLVTGVL
jgi:hypothetical protein